MDRSQTQVQSASDAPSPQISLVDCQDLNRMSAISGLSEDLIRSLSSGSSKHLIRAPADLNARPLPSPTARDVAQAPSLSATLEQSIDKGISSPVPVSDSLGFAYKARETPEGARPTKAAKTVRRSMFVEDLGDQDFGQGEDRQAFSVEVNKHAAPNVEWPLPTPTASPALGMRFHNSSTAVDDSEASYTRTQSPQQTTTSLTTVIGPQARRSPRLNFLPKFLRVKSPGGPKTEPAIEEKSPVGEATSPQSFFDDESSDGGEDSQIESAQHAIIASPVMVRHESKSRVGLQEMLGSSPSGQAEGTESLKERTVKLLGGDFDENNVSRPSIRSVREDEDGTISKTGPLGLSVWRETFASSPLKSKDTPPHLTPVPSPNPKPPRKVSFPAAPPLEIKPEHRFSRQSIVSTPYPPEEAPKRAKSVTSGAPRNARMDNAEAEAVLTLVVYGTSNTPPKVNRVVIPNRQQTPLTGGGTEKHSRIKATLTPDLDDEKLFKLIRKEYAGMRGRFRQLVSARTVRSIHLLSYQSTSQLVSRHGKPLHLDTGIENGDFAEARILKHFLSPKTGRKRHEWTQWIRSQPENIVETPSETDHVALELVEGWSPGKAYLAVVTVLVCSLAATILWVFIGARRGDLSLHNTFGASARLDREHAGYRDAAERVGSGAVLGLLVLLFGWTAVGAWFVLSWLIS